MEAESASALVFGGAYYGAVASEIEPAWVSRDLGDFQPTPLTSYVLRTLWWLVLKSVVGLEFRGYPLVNVYITMENHHF